MKNLYLRTKQKHAFISSSMISSALILSSYELIDPDNRMYNCRHTTKFFFTKHGKNGRFYSTGNKLRSQDQNNSLPASHQNNSLPQDQMDLLSNSQSQSESVRKPNTTDSPANFVSVILKSLNDPNNTFKNDENSQRSIESIVFEDYEFNYSANSTKFISGGINTEILTPMLNKMIYDKTDIIKVYIKNLLNEQNEVLNNPNNANKFSEIIKAKITTSFDVDFLFSICITHFLLIYTYQDTEEDKFLASINVSINIGKKMFAKYLNNLKAEYYKNTLNYITYTDWINKWKDDNKNLAIFYDDDDIYSRLGLNILAILSHSDLVEMLLIKSPDKIHRHYSLFVKDRNLMSSKNRRSIINLPARLPMVCPPKAYSKDILGGYLLNDEKFSENLLIDKKAYAKNSEL